MLINCTHSQKEECPGSKQCRGVTPLFNFPAVMPPPGTALFVRHSLIYLHRQQMPTSSTETGNETMSTNHAMEVAWLCFATKFIFKNFAKTLADLVHGCSGKASTSPELTELTWQRGTVTAKGNCTWLPSF